MPTTPNSAGQLTDAVPVREVAGLITTDETGRPVSVLPVRYVAQVATTDELGRPVDALPVYAATGLLTTDSGGRAVSVRPVRTVAGLTTTDEAGRRVPVVPVFLSGGGAAVPVIGGVAVGAPNGPASAYILSAGDDFAGSLDIITPANPFGKYSPTRAYMLPSAGQGPRQSGATGFGLYGHDVDPYYTGYGDANRGNKVASWADCMVQSGGTLALKARTATAPEKSLFYQSNLKDNCSAMVCSPAQLVFTAPFYIEFKTGFTAPGQVRGWHPSEWLMQMNSVRTFNDVEVDWEGTSTYDQDNSVSWVSAANTGYPGDFHYRANDGTMRLFGIEVTAAGVVNWYLEGVLTRTWTAPSFDATKPFYWLISNHITNFPEEPLVTGDWITAGAPGAVQATDFVRVSRAPAGAHYTPQVASQTITADAGVAFSTVLPTATAVWGSAVSEVVEAFMVEANEPGGNYSGGYDGFPSGVSYNTTTRTLSGTLSTPGTLHIVRYVTAAGSTCEPHRIAVNVGPVINTTGLTYAPGATVSEDIYVRCDCGVLVSNSAGVRTKTISVSGLTGSGLSYNDTTGLLTGTAAAGSYTMGVTVTNSVGQVKTSNIAVTVTASYTDALPVTSGLILDINPADPSKVAATGGLVDSIAASHGTSYAATSTGTARPTLNGNRLDFAGAQELIVDPALAALFTSSLAYTVAVIGNATSVAATQYFFDVGKSTTTSGVDRASVLTAAASDVRHRRASNSALQDSGSSGTGAPAITGSAHTLFGYAAAGSAVPALIMDGGTAGAAATPITLGGSFDTATIGNRKSTSGNAYLTGSIWRVLIYNRVLTNTERGNIRTWAQAQFAAV